MPPRLHTRLVHLESDLLSQSCSCLHMTLRLLTSLLHCGTESCSYRQPFALLLQFMDEHVTMQHVKRYALEVLQQWAALQTFEPQVIPGARCYKGQRCIIHVPVQAGHQTISTAYPWLEGLQQQCKRPVLSDKNFLFRP